MKRAIVGYGLLQQSKDGFTFNIESIKEFLENKTKYQRMNLSNEEKLEEISQRRNKIEKLLRFVLKNALKQTVGKKKAGDVALSTIPTSRRNAIESKNIDAILHKDNSPLYLIDLKNLISREWNIFKNIFDIEKNKLIVMLEDINSYGRPDAHAKGINNDEFTQLRLHFNKLEEILDDWAN